jgi:hypothetical protein
MPQTLTRIGSLKAAIDQYNASKESDEKTHTNVDEVLSLLNQLNI